MEQVLLNAVQFVRADGGISGGKVLQVGGQALQVVQLVVQTLDQVRL